MTINATKTKEIWIDFHKTKVNIPQLHIGNNDIEIASNGKLLGVIINKDLKWEKHVEHLYAKASKRLHYLRVLRRCGLKQVQLRQVYITLIRPVLEYACPVWSTSLSIESSTLLETMQKKSL